MYELSTHLTWEPREAVQAKEAVQEIQAHEGLEVILDAINQRKLDLMTQLLTRSPSDQGAEYADTLGRMKGLEEVPQIIAGVIENGRRAEHTLREQD